jgi:transposase
MGQRGTVLYTLLISARNHGVDPQAYLKNVIERMPVTRPADLDALLPDNWAPANRATRPLAKPLRSDAA